MFDQVDLVDRDAEGCSHSSRCPRFIRIEIKYLVLLRIEAAFDFCDGCVEEILFPFRVPQRLQIVAGLIDELLGGEGAGSGTTGRGLIGPGQVMHGEGSAFTELVGHAPAGHIQEPGLEGADGGVIFEVGHVFGDGNHCFLHDVLCFRLGQPAFASDVVDEFPVGIEEVLPTGLVLPILEPLDEGSAGWDQLVHGLRHE